MSIHVGLPGSVNDQRIVRRSRLWHEVMHKGLLSASSGYQDRIPLYILVDKGYPLLNWIMVPFKDDGQPRRLVGTYYNKRHHQGRSVVENVFGLLKENWQEMGKKTNLNVVIIPDVFYCCCILHNLTIRHGIVDVEDIMRHIADEATEEVMDTLNQVCFLTHYLHLLSVLIAHSELS